MTKHKARQMSQLDACDNHEDCASITCRIIPDLIERTESMVNKMKDFPKIRLQLSFQ